MDFIAALRLVHRGGAIKRIVWGNDDAHVKIYKGWLCIWKNEPIIEPSPSPEDERELPYHPWMISEADVYATDWQEHL